MKRKLACILILSTLLLSGCKSVESVNDNSKDTSMFVEIEHTASWRIVYHKETKVMYAVSYSGYNIGNFTLLVDADGKPMLWKE
jgi:uncharacterized protein YcfL